MGIVEERPMHILYQTTCLVNGKKYIGVHNGSNELYLGSGDALKNAIKRYGRKKFVRETLFEFATEEEAYAKEAEIVTEEIVKDPTYYNINVGGHRPPNATGRKIEDTSAYSKANKKKWSDPEYRERASASMSKAWKRTDERLEQLRTMNIGRKLTADHTQKLHEGRRKSAQVWTITDGDQTWSMSIREFSEMTNSSEGSIRQCVRLRGRYRHWFFTR